METQPFSEFSPNALHTGGGGIALGAALLKQHHGRRKGVLCSRYVDSFLRCPTPCWLYLYSAAMWTWSSDVYGVSPLGLPSGILMTNGTMYTHH
ncbi:hypothetical protein SKAU_G00354260 [Synaphobranchus kaupii]|uniref:Uncharacterized protein n=1 Tax=Synaphobranchus kaupii TaxID=118154 RepID=A0A9Q1IFG7_SYNKA|nr:hypothetical protein SKAU_G00354260 [Synaphobranchus kaupii]